MLCNNKNIKLRISTISAALTASLFASLFCFSCGGSSSDKGNNLPDGGGNGGDASTDAAPDGGDADGDGDGDTDVDTDSDTDGDTDTDGDADGGTDAAQDGGEVDGAADGGEQWWHTFYGSGDMDYGNSIAIDGSGNLYITGYSYESWNGPNDESPLKTFSGSRDIFILKLNSSGIYQWHTFFGSSDDDFGESLGVDGSGNVYITGESLASWDGPSGQSPLHAFSGSVSEDIFILKLNSSGAYQWHTFYGSSNDDIPSSLTIDGNGNLYLVGLCYGTWDGPSGQSPLHAFSGSYEICIVKLSSSGVYQWHTFYGSANDDRGLSLAMDGSGNLYMIGWSNASWNGASGESPLHAFSGNWDIFVLKLNSSGAYQWHTFYGSDNEDCGKSIAIDGSGNLYITGYSVVSWDGPSSQSPLHAYSGSYDIFVLKLNSSGAYQWHTFYGSSNDDEGYSLAVAESGNLYLVGSSYASWDGPSGQSPLHEHSGSEDILVLKFSPNGAYQSHTFYGSDSDDIGNSIIIGGSENLYITGVSYSSWDGPNGQNPLNSDQGGSDIIIIHTKQ